MIKQAEIRQMVSCHHLIDRLGVPRQTIMRWVNSGEFPKPHRFGRRILRWDAAAIESWIEAQRLADNTEDEE